MTTARDIVVSALRRAGIVGIDDQPEAADAEYSLELLNDMINGWETLDLDFSHTNFSLSTAIDSEFPAEYHEGLKILLSSAIAPAYSLSPPDVRGFDSQSWLNKFLNYKQTHTDLSVDAGLLNLPSQSSGWV